jgi:cytochrome c556
MMRTVMVVGVLVLGASAVVAQQDLVKQNQDIMKANAKAVTGLFAMIKGEKPYDQATVNAALTQLDDTAKKLPTMFPDSIKGLKTDGDYNATSKVWEDKAGFSARSTSFGKAVTDAKAKVKNLDTLKTEATAIGKECTACHETFRVKNG